MTTSAAPETINEIRKRYAQLERRKRPFFLNSDYSLTDLASHLKVNRTYASRFINNNFGVSFPVHLQNLRLAKAIELMKEQPCRPLVEIARAAGFNCDLSFRRSFIRRYGVLPSQFGTQECGQRQGGETTD